MEGILDNNFDDFLVEGKIIDESEISDYLDLNSTTVFECDNHKPIEFPMMSHNYKFKIIKIKENVFVYRRSDVGGKTSGHQVICFIELIK